MIALVVLNGHTIQLSTKKQNNSTILWFSHINCYVTSAWKKNVIWSYISGKWHSKCQTSRETIFSNYLMMNIFLSSLLIQKIVLGSNYLVIQTLCVQEWLKLLQKYASIKEYHLRFFPRENFNCLCETYLIKSRYYILHKCRRYNNYWNLNSKSLNYFVAFFEYNPEAFSFYEGITW